jgi:hypothetical protein
MTRATRQAANGGARSSAKMRWAAALLSIVIALIASEALVRWSLFHTSLDLATKDPEYYARTADELWIYRALFAGPHDDAATIGGSEFRRDTRIPFYQRWAASLVPDAELGYVRKANVRLPCHETTNLATRGTHDYATTGPKLVFFGDSFVESAACSDDTLTAKVEQMAGVDTLNYGVGGYGLDQMFLLFDRVRPTFDRDDNVVLIGLIEDDLERVLLKVRSSPKPYFTVADDRLTLHTGHIHPATLPDYFKPPPERSYLLDFVRGRFGSPVYPTMRRATRDERRQAVRTITRLLFDRFAERARAGRFKLAFVILPQPGLPFDPEVLALLRERDLPAIDLQTCLRRSGRPDSDLYAELHPTSLGNTLLADCLIGNLRSVGWLQ